jgi:hypothetical protein
LVVSILQYKYKRTDQIKKCFIQQSTSIMIYINSKVGKKSSHYEYIPLKVSENAQWKGWVGPGVCCVGGC